MYDLIIIGAGPAGLTAAYELSNSDKKIHIIEKKQKVGGLAETKVFGDYRYDIGPHRFFTKHIRSAVEILKEKKVDFEFDSYQKNGTLSDTT